jgi:hypothetical protein
VTELFDNPLEISRNLTEYSWEKPVKEKTDNKIRYCTKFFKKVILKIRKLNKV